MKRHEIEASGLLGSFEHLDTMLEAAQSAKRAGIDVHDIYTPVPVEEAVELVSPGVSPVRWYTGLGAFLGMAGGFVLAIETSKIWDLIVGGKPVTHHVPFVVVGFELLILFGAFFTLGALLFYGRLPFTKFPTKAYRPEFTEDRFGVWLRPTDEQHDRAEAILREAGAADVIAVKGLSGS